MNKTRLLPIISVVLVVFVFLFTRSKTIPEVIVTSEESVVTTIKQETWRSHDHKKAINNGDTNITNYQQHDNDRAITRPPLCNRNTAIIIFANMRHNLIRQFFAHNTEAKNCKLPDSVTTCLFTDDSRYYHTADVLYIRACFTPSSHINPAYPEQIVINYNRGPERKKCNDPESIMKVTDIRVSYSLSSTIPFPYMCWPDIQQPLLDALKLKPPSGRHGVVMFISDCGSFSTWRYDYVKELMNYIHIDSYGNCLHNVNISSSRHKGTDDFGPIKIDLIKSKRYKFLISFENSVVQEYVTEKIWHAYLTQTIPIYYGPPEVYNQVPGNNSFIDATKFAGPKELAQYINEVEQNKSLYKSYFKFDINQTVKFQKNCPSEPLGCTMCKKFYQLKKKRCEG